MIVSLPTFEAAKTEQGHSASVDVLNGEGRNGWEAVGMNCLADGAVAVLLKRARADEHAARRGRPDRLVSSRPSE